MPESPGIITGWSCNFSEIAGPGRRSGSVRHADSPFVQKSASSSEIPTINFDGSDPRRVTNLNALTLSSRWSPGGRFLVFTSYKEGNPDIYPRGLERRATRKIVFCQG